MHLLEDDIRDRSMHTLHVVCHVAYSGSRLTAGRLRRRKLELFSTPVRFSFTTNAKNMEFCEKENWLRVEAKTSWQYND